MLLVQEVSGRLDSLAEQSIIEREFSHVAQESWVVAPDAKAEDVGNVVASLMADMRQEVLALHSDYILRIQIGHGSLNVLSMAANPETARRGIQYTRERIPHGENPDPDVVPVAFWSYSPNGARNIRRDLDAETWEAIEDNYTSDTREKIARLMGGEFRPGIGGQLILWHGEPGTGKTTALRALAREWRKWCEVHYIVDPEGFFGAHADYMIDVMMGQGNPMDIEDFEYDSEGDKRPEPKWRLLILEDCGEMLQPDARREVGQALSRFLNACDGMIGRGLRFMVLVTTNEPVTKLHEAVARPGRCAAVVEFEHFNVLEANSWLRGRGYEGDTPKLHVTLADLYAHLGGTRTNSREPAVGFAR